MRRFDFRGPRPARRRGTMLRAELLEDRATPAALTPAAVRTAYGFDQIPLPTGSTYDSYAGAGQTIAIVDAYDDPYIASDLAAFNALYNLPAVPSFLKVSQTGSTTALPRADSGWGLEIALDVEWAHAIAPQANILLVEANSASLGDLLAAVDYARAQTGVTVVSMSWGGSEFSSEASYDSHFLTPTGHPGVTFVASSGDSGAPASWPAVSPNVVGVGGTHLTLNTDGTWNSETGWSGSGGGVSSFESKPGYQSLVTTPSSTKKSSPDVAYDADPNTGFAVYDSYSGGWAQVGGTSAGAPQWAALVAIANQGRAAAGSLDGPSQTLYALYTAAKNGWAATYHDVTSGSNGTSAKTGFDTVTGLGSPLANQVISALVSWTGSGSTSGGTTTTTGKPGGGKATRHAVVLSDTPAETTPAAGTPATTVTVVVVPVATVPAVLAPVTPVSPAPVVVPAENAVAGPPATFAPAAQASLPPVGYAYTVTPAADAGAFPFVPPRPWLPIPSGDPGPDVPGFDELRRALDPDAPPEEAAAADPIADVDAVEVSGVEVDG